MAERLLTLARQRQLQCQRAAEDNIVDRGNDDDDQQQRWASSRGSGFHSPFVRLANERNRIVRVRL